MTAMIFDVGYRQQVDREYNLWRRRQAETRGPGQLGGPILADVMGGPYPDGTVYMQFEDAFVNELECSGSIPFKRAPTAIDPNRR
jgi:hypothetical protein